MPFKLVAPVKRQGSSIPQFVKRIPADVKPRLLGLRLSIPLAGEAVSITVTEAMDAIRFSLRTSVPSEIKVRQAEAAAYLEQVFSAARASAPMALSHRQATALAGEMYRSWADTTRPVRSLTVGVTGADRGIYAETLEGEESEPVYAATLMMLDRAKARGEPEDLEPMFGRIIDRLLIARGIAAVDAPSRRLLLTAFWQAMRDAMEVQGRAARGDYTPDSKAERFPPWTPLEPSHSPNSSRGSRARLGLEELLEGWWKEARAAGIRERTYQGYRATILRFRDFLKHDDAEQVSADDVVRFKEHRLSSKDPRTGQPISARTVKDSDLAALKSVFGWATRNRKLRTNPADGISIRLSKRTRTRESGFRDDEVRSLLSACLALTRGKDRAETFAAKKWIPWLLAYTGARVGEIAQLRKQDVRRSADHWSIFITPEAGTVKTNDAREVPLHPHLVELGFIAFVEGASEGHLFLRPNPKTGDVLGPLAGVKNRVREFVRQHITDPNVQPNHGWRHLFITRCRQAGVDLELRRMLTGHSGSAVDERIYGDPAGLYREICKLPRFQLAE